MKKLLHIEVQALYADRMKTILFAFLMIFASFANAASVSQQFLLNNVNQQFVYSATTTSLKALDVNLSRGYLMIQNIGTDYITVNLRAADTGAGIQLYPGSALEFSVIPTNSIWIKSNSGTQSVIVLEGTAQ